MNIITAKHNALQTWNLVCACFTKIVDLCKTLNQIRQLKVCLSSFSFATHRLKVVKKKNFYFWFFKSGARIEKKLTLSPLQKLAITDVFTTHTHTRTQKKAFYKALKIFIYDTIWEDSLTQSLQGGRCAVYKPQVNLLTNQTQADDKNAAYCRS